MNYLKQINKETEIAEYILKNSMKNKELLIKQIVLFSLVGGICFLIDYGVFLLLSHLMHYLLASFFSFCISLICNYGLSMKFVFIGNKRNVKEFFIFILISIGGLCIQTFLLYLLVDILKWNIPLSKILANFIVMIYNFIGKKIFLET